MAQSSLRQFYTVRKRPQEEHGSLKRRKLTEETRLDIPAVGKGVDPLSLPFTQPTLVTTTATGAQSKTRASTQRSAKSRGRGKTTTRSQRRRKSPPLPGTPSIVLPSPPASSDQPKPSNGSDGDTGTNQAAQQSLTSSTSSHPSTSSTTGSKKPTLLTDKTAGEPPDSADEAEVAPATRQQNDTPSSPAKRKEDSSSYDEEDPLLLPSTPKSPKQDISSALQSKSHTSDASSSTTLPPPRSRMNLAERLRLAASDSPTSLLLSSSSTTSSISSQTDVRKVATKTASKPLAKNLAQKTPQETRSDSSSTPVPFPPPKITTKRAPTPSAKDLAEKTVAETHSSTSAHSSQRNVRKAAAKTASARQLAQKTVAETQSSPSVHSRLRNSGAKRPSARELAKKTVAETNSERAQELLRRVEGRSQQSRPVKATTSGASEYLSNSEAISRLYKLSARELAQQTEPERRRAAVVRRDKGKSPAPPTTPQLQQFQSFVVESPTKSPSKQPAYQRFHSLARAAAETPDLPLPYKYQVLLEKFRCTDTVVTMLQKRREICTFGKLKQAVEEMTRRKYENRNLAQMKSVYPRAFVFRQEKNIPGVYDKKMYESYQLTVECNVKEDGREEGEGEKEEEKEKKNAVLDSSALLRRKKVFNKNLGEITRRHHKQFLSSLNPPLDIPDEKVLRWHPAFQLDCVPDVEEAELPKPPLTETYTTAQDVLNAAQGRLAPRIQQVLEGVAGSSERKGAESVKEVGGVSAPLDPALRGISQKLLEKIQQKEATRVKSDITRDPVQEKRLEMLARMPHLTRIIRSLFVTEKKAAIPWDVVIQKLLDSHTSCLPPDGVEEHLEFMRESLGGWLSVVEVRKRRFVKINKNTDSQLLTARMDDVRKKLLA